MVTSNACTVTLTRTHGSLPGRQSGLAGSRFFAASGTLYAAVFLPTPSGAPSVVISGSHALCSQAS